MRAMNEDLEVPVFPETIDFSAVCRTCLGLDTLRPIFSSYSDHEEYSTAILITMGVKVKKDDGLPQQMCTDCINHHKNSMAFRKKCKEVELKLLQAKKEYDMDVKVKNEPDNDDDSEIKEECEKTHYSHASEVAVKCEIYIEEETIDRDPLCCPKRRKLSTEVEDTKECICHICHKEPSDLSSHMMKNHPEADDRVMHGLKIYQCEHCSSVFQSRNSLIVHLNGVCVTRKRKLNTISKMKTNTIHKTKPMTMDEVLSVVDLIQGEEILLSKETNAATNRLKEDAWGRVTDAFNATFGTFPRSIDQLKLKWDNLKKAARKRTRLIRLNSLNTSGGTTKAIKPNYVLDKVCSVVVASCTGAAAVPYSRESAPRESDEDDEIPVEVEMAEDNNWLFDNPVPSPPRKKKTKKLMTKEQVLTLVDLIQVEEILHSKKINAATNKRKEAAWGRVVDAFNAKFGTSPRSADQLKLKWDNLKRAALKRSHLIRLNLVNTGGGTTNAIKPSYILDKVCSIVGASCSGGAVASTGEAVPGESYEDDEVPVQVEMAEDKDWLFDNPVPSPLRKKKTKRPMTLEEGSYVVDLIQGEKEILLNKETNAAANKLKEAAWGRVTDAFNAKFGTFPRSKDQMQIKWDNLKKAARKRSQLISSLKTGGSTLDTIKPDDVLDKVCSILGTSCSGAAIPSSGEAVPEESDEDDGLPMKVDMAEDNNWHYTNPVPSPFRKKKTKKPMTQEEVSYVVDLIQGEEILLSRETNAATNKLKEAAWGRVTDAFNAKFGTFPRSKDQMQIKWDNLKKAARKRSQLIRSNVLESGGGTPDGIKPDDVLDRVCSILGATCAGAAGPSSGDDTAQVENAHDCYSLFDISVQSPSFANNRRSQREMEESQIRRDLNISIMNLRRNS